MKKFISLFTMVAFFVFSLSCTFTKTVKYDADAVKENGNIKIVQVVTKSGETIEFSKGQPGRIHNGSITGTAIKVTGELDKEYIKETEIDKKGKILSFMVSIPLSEVELVSMGKSGVDLTIATVMGILLVFYIAIRSSVESQM